jgi:hypothetical protein
MAMSNSFKNVSFAVAGIFVLAAGGLSASARALDHDRTSGASSLADSVRGVEGIYCGIECADTARTRRVHEHHAPASASHEDWYGLDTPGVDDSSPVSDQ